MKKINGKVDEKNKWEKLMILNVIINERSGSVGECVKTKARSITFIIYLVLEIVILSVDSLISYSTK